MDVSMSNRYGFRCVNGKKNADVLMSIEEHSASEIPLSWFEFTMPFSATYDATGEKTEPALSFCGKRSST